jgi:membrane protease subunit (stomatin/prohibitin family)
MVFGRGKSTGGDVARNTYTWPQELKGSDATGFAVMYKLPTNVQYNDNIVVMEDEYAVFFRDGKALHVFDQPGRFALTTTNVPVLGTLGAMITGVRQLGEVYYVQRREMRGKFGTPEPLTFSDRDFGLVRLRVFGNLSFKIVDPIVFITQMVGTNQWTTPEPIVDWLRSELVVAVNDAMGELKRDRNMALVDMPAYLQEIQQMVISKAETNVGRFGLKITSITGLTITPPEEVAAAIDKRSSMGALGVNYMQYQTGKAIEGVGEGAAKGGDASSFAGLGAGMGAGYAMGGQMQQGMNQPGGPPQQGIPCPKCNTLIPGQAKFCPNCGGPSPALGTPCAKCGKPVPAGAKFCNECGAPTANAKVPCPKCKAMVQAGAKFCAECGAPMGV